MNQNLDHAILVAQNLPLTISRFEELGLKKARVVRYEHIEDSPTDLILELAEFLECDMNRTDAEAISQKFSRENVKLSISATDDELEKKLERKEAVNDNEIVRLSPRDYRAFNPETGFQSGHVSDRLSGEWRSQFSEAQISRIIDALDVCARVLGYQSES